MGPLPKSAGHVHSWNKHYIMTFRDLALFRLLCFFNELYKHNLFLNDYMISTTSDLKEHMVKFMGSLLF